MSCNTRDFQLSFRRWWVLARHFRCELRAAWTAAVPRTIQWFTFSSSSVLFYLSPIIENMDSLTLVSSPKLVLGHSPSNPRHISCAHSSFSLPLLFRKPRKFIAASQSGASPRTPRHGNFPSFFGILFDCFLISDYVVGYIPAALFFSFFLKKNILCLFIYYFSFKRKGFWYFYFYLFYFILFSGIVFFEDFIYLYFVFLVSVVICDHGFSFFCFFLHTSFLRGFLFLIFLV